MVKSNFLNLGIPLTRDAPGRSSQTDGGIAADWVSCCAKIGQLVVDSCKCLKTIINYLIRHNNHILGSIYIYYKKNAKFINIPISVIFLSDHLCPECG